MRVLAQSKSLDIDEEGRAVVLNEHYKELKSEGFALILSTIKDKNTRGILVREHNHDGYSAYQYIIGLWGNTALSRHRAMDKDTECSELIRKGARSGYQKDMTEFVENLLMINSELKDANYHFGDELLINHMLSALRRHNAAFVRGIQGSLLGTGIVWCVDDFPKVITSRLNSKHVT
ncbi:MAG: hypothetical protein SGPRY_004417 [Prymnesium sp.]